MEPDKTFEARVEIEDELCFLGMLEAPFISLGANISETSTIYDFRNTTLIDCSQ